VKALICRLISTCLGIGYTPKGGGTIAAIVCCIAWYFAWRGGNGHFWTVGDRGPLVAEALVTVALFFLGVYVSGQVEAQWGKDSYRVVIDEVAGMCLTLFAIPDRWPYICIGLVLFRFFDIAKPLYIRRTEQWRGGWGVMMDDMLAGVYANLLLQIVVLFKPW
jgi:phosphatidylglycerophosphatase A